MTLDKKIFTAVSLDPACRIYLSDPIDAFDLSVAEFDRIWSMHPEAFHTLVFLGKPVQTPRWQQAYGKSYNYSGSSNTALPVPAELNVFLNWTRNNVDQRLNGLLLNWYEGSRNHYIGPHRDDTRDLWPHTPIVTISLGEERLFRMRPYRGSGFKDFLVRHASAIVLPWETNKRWTHEVPNFKKYNGRRISITLRAFK